MVTTNKRIKICYKTNVYYSSKTYFAIFAAILNNTPHL